MRRTRRRVGLAILLVIAALAVVLAPAGGTGGGTALAALSRLSGAEIERYLQRHPEVSAQALNARPAEVAEWWGAASHDERLKMLVVVPELVGNLGGVDYRTRDQANRLHLRQTISDARERAARSPSNSLVAHRLSALKAIESALRGTDPPRALVSLTTDSPPLAAVAVGDLDTARQVTFNVPGMGTYTDDMQLWTGSAQNVYDAQGTVGAPAGRAVVAWIGYETPPPGIDATLGEYAARGAPYLVADLEGLRAAREYAVDAAQRRLDDALARAAESAMASEDASTEDASEGRTAERPGDRPDPDESAAAPEAPNAPRGMRDAAAPVEPEPVAEPVPPELESVSIIAHSYGTTTAANALAAADDLGVFAFVMLGSAGIEARIDRAADLHVEHVYAGEAAEDNEARWGRLDRRDPRAPSFGATVIGVDGDPAADLLPVTGHDPILHSRWNDDPDSPVWASIPDPASRAARYLQHTVTFGYLDAGTESLLNAATATTPDANRQVSR